MCQSLLLTNVFYDASIILYDSSQQKCDQLLPHYVSVYDLPYVDDYGLYWNSFFASWLYIVYAYMLSFTLFWRKLMPEVWIFAK